MQRFWLFIKKIYFFLLFIILESVAITFYANSSSYKQAKILAASGSVFGDVQTLFANVKEYFYLKDQNDILVERLLTLERELSQIDTTTSPLALNRDEMTIVCPYYYNWAKVINNSVSAQENYFTLNKGARDGVKQGMAVTSLNKYALGYVLATSDKFSVCISMINTKFRTSGKIKNTDYFGSIYWDGRNINEITLTEISKYASPQKGDTVVTTSYSAIFPSEILIGTIESCHDNENGSFQIAKVKLFADMTTLNKVVLISYEDAQQQITLEQETIANY